ncbi:MAG: fluoride efflux transporter CrcB [Bacteroidetes bacterium]|jgi:CrcB protein|nr:fluoride efflux transporter CrcB [Bacteroidota bacterium]
MWQTYVTVFIGGGIGAALRYWVSGIAPRYFGTGFPYGILFVNVAGCLFIGLFMTWFEGRFLVSPALRTFLVIGILGGFTTFSTFSYETIYLVRDAEYLLAALYVSASVVLGLGATVAGGWLGRLL